MATREHDLPVEVNVPSRALPIDQAVLGLVADLNKNAPDDEDPIEEYLWAVYWRSVVTAAGRMLTAKSGSALAKLAARGLTAAQIRDRLAEVGVTITDDGVAHLVALAAKASCTRHENGDDSIDR